MTRRFYPASRVSDLSRKIEGRRGLCSQGKKIQEKGWNICFKQFHNNSAIIQAKTFKQLQLVTVLCDQISTILRN